jgi:large subunit ribosomal protein L21
MYAVIETGGKQYRVEVGTELEVELLDVEPGQAITLDRVLLVADGDESSIGRPLVTNAAVSAEVLRQTRGEKLISFKYRPKARSRVKKGHRQELTVLRITDVRLGSKSAAESVRRAEADAKTERQRLEEAAATQAAKDAELAAKLAVGTEGTPAKTKTAAKPKTETKAKGTTETTAKSKAGTKAATETKAPAKTSKTSTTAATRTKADSKSTAPKPATAKADADAPKAKAEVPKRTRATKKDE